MFLNRKGEIEKVWWEGEFCREDGHTNSKIGIIHISVNKNIPKIDTEIPLNKQDLTKLKNFLLTLKK